MRHVTSALSTMILGTFLCVSASASTELGRLASEFDAAWAAAGGPAPPLGVSLVSLTDSERSMLGITDGRGVRLTGVDQGSLGERLGLKVNDIVVGLNGSPVHSGEEFVSLVRSRDPARSPYFELLAQASAAPTMGAPAAQSDAAPIDCGPNPTVECSMRMLRESWSKLREALK